MIKRETVQINGKEIDMLVDMAKATINLTDEELDNLIEQFNDKQIKEFGWQAIRFCWSASHLNIEDFGGVRHWNRLVTRLIARYRSLEEEEKKEALERLHQVEREEMLRQKAEIEAIEKEAKFEIKRDDVQREEDVPAYPIVKATMQDGRFVEVELFIGGFSMGNSISRIVDSNMNDEEAKALAWKALKWYKMVEGV